MFPESHYDYLKEHFMDFYNNVCEAECVFPSHCVNEGIIVAHGDKCYSYRDKFESNGIPFAKGVAIYLLSYLNPWDNEVRETANGWVAPDEWVVDNKSRFLPYLP